MTELKVVSGGQTGFDRAALDAARKLELCYGGFTPQGRWTENGPLPADYEGMMETESAGASQRTKLNVRESDATLIITRGDCEGGTLLTADTARKCGKPLLIIDLAEVSGKAAATAISEWIAAVRPGTLNVAGPRASKDEHIYDEAKAILLTALAGL